MRLEGGAWVLGRLGGRRMLEEKSALLIRLESDLVIAVQIFSRCRHLRLFILIVGVQVSIGDGRASEISISFFNVMLQGVYLVDVV